MLKDAFLPVQTTMLTITDKANNDYTNIVVSNERAGLTKFGSAGRYDVEEIT